MANSKRNKKSKKQKKQQSEEPEKIARDEVTDAEKDTPEKTSEVKRQSKKVENATKTKSTIEEIDAISSEDSDDDDENDAASSIVNATTDDDGDDEEWNDEARALRQAIAEGAFDSLNDLNKSKTGNDIIRNDKDVVMTDGDENNDEGTATTSRTNRSAPPTSGNTKALRARVTEMREQNRGVPWIENMDVIPSAPLPFGRDDAGGDPVDVHDDLKREVAFYNVALDAVREAKAKFKEAGVPFTRPEDFFAEMIKTDEHMAKVKDRLIFESKKITAFEQRKNNRETKLRAKEARAKKQEIKSKMKQDHMTAVQNWAASAASNRPTGGMVRDDDDDYLSSMGGPNKKRMAADKKYGLGGKKGRFKVMDKKDINDMSGYVARFGGSGGAAMRPRAKGGAGANRKGKRARDAARRK